ncbi:hypothetical protein [Cupriavidus sp. CuC1]|uniref:hypothetical protein n=1 Tax=Cupriavidus sp. CuC1 TaxID=3373131 RepID=UPI0037CF6FF6
MIVIEILERTAPIRAPPKRRGQTCASRFLDVQFDRRLCGNAAYERTFALAASRSPSHVRFILTIARLDRLVTAPGSIQHPV